jgi:hypothetical protein
MTKRSARPAMAMIELIFAIVIIAISVLSIPSMIAVADKMTKQITIDDDVMSRLSGWTIDKFQARWDKNYFASGSGPLQITGTEDLNCSPGAGTALYRANPYSTVQCSQVGMSPSTIPSGDGNLSKGIEQLNGGSEPITITPAGGVAYFVTASYAVSYVDSTVTGTNTQNATWILGASSNMSPSTSGTSHLKRVVTRFDSPDSNITLTFFKSNKGN